MMRYRDIDNTYLSKILSVDELCILTANETNNSRSEIGSV